MVRGWLSSIFKVWPGKHFAQRKKMLERGPRGSSQVKLEPWALLTALILQCPGRLLWKQLVLSGCRLGCGRGVGKGDCKWQTEKGCQSMAILTLSLLLLFRHAQDKRLATSPKMVKRLHQTPPIVMRVHVRKSNVVILTPETAVTIGV